MKEKTNVSFSVALLALKNGERIAREGWNGKGMHLWLNKGAVDGNKEKTPLIDGVTSDLFEDHGEGVTTRMPNINMRSASGATVTGWLASQTDLLAEDWVIL